MWTGNPWGRGRGRGRGAPAVTPPAETVSSPGGGGNNAPARDISEGAQAVENAGGSPTASTSKSVGRGGGATGRGRGARRRPLEEDFDLVHSRPKNADNTQMTKKAVLGNSKSLVLQANFFKVMQRPDWSIFHYHVDFKGEEFPTHIKKQLFRPHARLLGVNIFDGSSLFTSQRLNPDPMLLYSNLPNSDEKVEISVKLVGELAPTDATSLMVFNILVRKCLAGMGLLEVGRFYYDPFQAISIPAHHLALWPGFITRMRHHEQDILFQVELTTKVIRQDSCLQFMSNYWNSRENCYDRARIAHELVGTVVMSMYNRKTYKVDDIDWESTPMSTFQKQDSTEIHFVDYYYQRYNLTVRNLRQPLLVSRPTKKDFHRGSTKNVLLIPELCQMTGLSEDMRQNRALMSQLAQHFLHDPSTRVVKLDEFMRRLKASPEISQELNQWGLKINNSLVNVPGHVIPNEKILFGVGHSVDPNERNYDWSHAFRTSKMYKTIPLQNWAVITPTSGVGCVSTLVSSMQRVATPLGFLISKPLVVHPICGSGNPSDYVNAVDFLVNRYGKELQLLLAILPNQNADRYSAVKKRTCLEFGVLSQCFVMGRPRGKPKEADLSICTKLVTQMNAKLGGEPWTILNPLQKQNLMILGFDVHHSGKQRGASVGAMVASTSASLGKYFSTTSFHSSRNEMSERMGANFTKCLHAYHKVNGFLPDRIIMYRDGVGEGQLFYVYNTELQNILEAISSVYKSAGREKTPPKFTFIVVTKRINARLFTMQGNRHVNPGPGTVADDVITLPERYDFYLISQSARQGTVSPVSYNVLYDTQGVDSDKIQRLTFKLCHLYYNWSGTVSVPAPCQYAHKLAYLTGVSLGAEANERLSNRLYFL